MHSVNNWTNKLLHLV